MKLDKINYKINKLLEKLNIYNLDLLQNISFQSLYSWFQYCSLEVKIYKLNVIYQY